MTIRFIVIGKTDAKALEILISEYTNRLKHYIKFDFEIIADLKNVKNFSEKIQKEKEGELIEAKLTSSDHVILLDEKGKKFTSIGFADFMQKKMNSGIKNLVFIVGGPYGFSDKIYALANGKISLSDMTFSHQMIRLLFVEQVYRAFTILKNEPYHHE
jgi:23S rRNA (pseudouridine1915-N3)-methyltransferase